VPDGSASALLLPLLAGLAFAGVLANGAAAVEARRGGGGGAADTRPAQGTAPGPRAGRLAPGQRRPGICPAQEGRR
jgi:hypothetical protein